jgi:hypothetical protein
MKKKHTRKNRPSKFTFLKSASYSSAASLDRKLARIEAGIRSVSVSSTKISKGTPASKGYAGGACYRRSRFMRVKQS